MSSHTEWLQIPICCGVSCQAERYNAGLPMSTIETQYQAAAFHSEFEGGRKSGTLFIGSTELRFEGDGSAISLPLRGLEIRAGGASRRLLFFSHRDFGEWAICTADKSVLEDRHLLSDPASASGIAFIRNEKRKSIALVTSILIGIVGLTAALFAMKDPIVRMVVRRIPASVEQKLGNVAIRQMMLLKREVNDPVVTQPLQSILVRITSATGAKQDFKLYVVRDSDVNAFALPGGHLVVNTGLIEKAQSGEEIAGVMAHEVAHVTERHSLQQLVSTIGVFALVQLLFGDVSGILAIATDGGAQLLTKSFSRDAERDADLHGVDYLHRAKIDPRGMLLFFGKLQEEEVKLGSAEAEKAFEVLSTHPTTASRIESLKNEVERRENGAGYRAIEINLSSMKEALGKNHQGEL